MPAQKIVIVEDNISLADIYKTRLEMIGYKCFVAYDGEQALAVIKTEKPNLVLLDLMVPKIAGDQILAKMRASDWGKDIKVYIISNLNESDAPPGIRDYGIEGYTVKANLSNDAIDKLVDDILKPKDQKEDVSLETNSHDQHEQYGEEAHFDPMDVALPPMPPPPPDPNALLSDVVTKPDPNKETSEGRPMPKPGRPNIASPPSVHPDSHKFLSN